MTSDPGTYALLLRNDRPQTIRVGAKGEVDVRPGTYVYVGSAFGPGGVQARVRRHAAYDKTCHWHVDYVRAAMHLTQVWYTHDATRRECDWAAALRHLDGSRPVRPGLGASDCTCSTHLFVCPTDPPLTIFRQRLQDAHPDHGEIRKDEKWVPGCG